MKQKNPINNETYRSYQDITLDKTDGIMVATTLDPRSHTIENYDKKARDNTLKDSTNWETLTFPPNEIRSTSSETDALDSPITNPRPHPAVFSSVLSLEEMRLSSDGLGLNTNLPFLDFPVLFVNPG